MPTNKRRVMFTVDPAIAADLEAIARFRGQPLSRVVAESLLKLAPVFRQTVTAQEWLERADSKAAELAARYTGDFQRKLAPAVQEIHDATRRAQEMVDAIEAGRPAKRGSNVKPNVAAGTDAKRLGPLLKPTAPRPGPKFTRPR
uniref:Uncharacterized protein n=1 Tax=uncultured prokaryote TaxID=198431 RepID=A0A0H5Q537_9ZZZZ|nr:hypothetical protein [uncultured prokaryote]